MLLAHCVTAREAPDQGIGLTAANRISPMDAPASAP
jgi:hypothetical protein